MQESAGSSKFSLSFEAGGVPLSFLEPGLLKNVLRHDAWKSLPSQTTPDKC
jgi:hypothetical protein